MRNGKHIFMAVGIVAALLVCGLVLSCTLLQPPQQSTSPLTNEVNSDALNESPGQINPPNSSAAMKNTRNTDTSNFDNVLRF